jgi:acyl-CoA synthetase (AMP-forming)/AMP-acid ligase II
MRPAKPYFETSLRQSRIKEMELNGDWSNRLFFDSLRYWASRQPDAIAIKDSFGDISWDAFTAEVEAVSCGLLELGVSPGVVVQIQLPNWRHFVISVAAVERIGAVVNPVSTVVRSNELAVISKLAQPMVVITASNFRGFELASMHAQLREECDWVKELIVVGLDAPVNAMTWDELVEQGRFSTYDRSAVELVTPNPNDVCELIFTSETCGDQKGVMHTQNTLNAASEAFISTVCQGVTTNFSDIAPEGLIFHLALPLGDQTGYVYGIRAPLESGGQLVLQDVWDSKECLRLIEKHKVQVSIGSALFLNDLLEANSLKDCELSEWKRFVHVGASIPASVLKRADERLPCVVLPGWEKTECGLLTVCQPIDSLERRLSDGYPHPGNRVRVVDDKGLTVVNREGNLQCQGSFCFVGYLQGRELTESCWDGEWFDTGDRASVDSLGYIKIVRPKS